MQAITHIAPAIAALFFTQFIVSLAGITAPLAYVVGVLVVLMLGNTLVQFSKHLPSAGGTTRTSAASLSPRAGFITSWMYVLYSPLSGGPIYGFFGFILAGELKAHYDINVPWLWWVCIVVGAPIVAFLQYRGIRISAGRSWCSAPPRYSSCWPWRSPGSPTPGPAASRWASSTSTTRSPCPASRSPSSFPSRG
jgi:amino acid transporter